MRAILLEAAGVLVLALALASCGNLDTVGGHYPGMKVYQPAGGGYHLHYADPPWVEADPTTDHGLLTPQLVAKAVYLGVQLDLEAYLLQVDVVSCASAAAVASAERDQALAAGELVDVDVRELRSSAGDVGRDFVTRDGRGTLKTLLTEKAQSTVDDQGFTVRARRAYFEADGAAQTCFRILVLSVYELDEPDLTFMLRSFEPRAQGAVDGGGA